MDEKDFKKHLQDLAHGHHHPEDQDWSAGEDGATSEAQTAKGTAPNRNDAIAETTGPKGRIPPSPLALAANPLRALARLEGRAPDRMVAC